jgi:hypothetical protein
MPFTTEAVAADQYVLIRHEGHLTREELEEGRSSAKKMLEENNWKKLLVDMRGVKNRLASVDVFHVMESNRTVLPFIKIGLVFPPEREEEGRFAENVATNRGGHLKSFVDYEQAVAWLTGKQT